MTKFFFRMILTAATALICSQAAFSGQLDEYYLQKFGESPQQKAIQQIPALQKAVLDFVPVDAERCGTPLKKSLQADWNQLEPATQKVLAKQLEAPVLTGEKTFVSSGNHFRIHYATSGSDAPPLTSSDGVTPDWVKTVAATFESVWNEYRNRGYHAAPTSGPYYEIYLRDLASQKIYGQTTSLSAAPLPGFPYAFTSYIEIDKDFTNAIYTRNSRTPLQSLQVTAAHEYHHAIQAGYTYYFEAWYGEATSTWYEDELYDTINQSYAYVPAWFQNSTLSFDIAVKLSDATTTGAGYGRWIFNRYLAERYGLTVVRSIWESAANVSPVGGKDISMVSVLNSVITTTSGGSLSADFFGFARRVYLRDWSSHASDIGLIHDYVPVASYTSYPVHSLSSPAPAVTLPHYSFAYYRFTPAFGLPSNLSITVTATSKIQATTFLKNANGTITEYPFTGVNNATVLLFGFGGASEAVLLLVNNSNDDAQAATFSTDGSVTPPTPTPTPTPTPVPASSSGGGGGCFIATAAYGSYLHPKVQVLRDFRDRFLLTNAPGRSFVRLYYHMSPPMAGFIARHDSLRGATRTVLTPIIFSVERPALAGGMIIFMLFGTLVVLRRKAVSKV